MGVRLETGTKYVVATDMRAVYFSDIKEARDYKDNFNNWIGANINNGIDLFKVIVEKVI